MRRSLLGLFSLVSVSSVLACSSGYEALPALSSEAGPTAPGSNADGGAEVPQGKPAEPAAPPVKADEINERFGVFVSKGGSAQNPGTREAPFGSIGDAIVKAKADKKRVFVCEGTYEESLELANGVSIMGGLDCSAFEWKLTEKRSIVASPASPAVKATNITMPTRIDNLDVRSPDATTPSGSSIGVLVLDSNALTFAKGTVTAGAATKGDDGIEGESVKLQFDSLATAGRNSQTCIDPVTQACTNVGLPGGVGARAACITPSGVVVSRSEGGAGGYGGVYRRMGSDWSVVAASGQGGMGVPSVPGANGKNGTSGTVGTLSELGYVPADGTPGDSGGPGKGGRGGDGQPRPTPGGSGTQWAASGAGGGPGGCGGLAGTAGKGGGGSFGVIALRSPVRLEAMTITSGAGGAGGQGTVGSFATEGGLGGDFEIPNDPTHSQYGGPGGTSGISGNGGGGPSVAIAHQGLAPLLTQTTTKVGAGGAGVVARSQSGKTVPASPAGASEGVKAF